MAKSKFNEDDPREKEYQAKIVATSMALSGFYGDAMNAIIAHQADEKPQEDIPLVLDELATVWATRIVDDISPKKTLIM